MTKRFSLVVLSFFFLIAHCSSAYPQAAAPASKSTLLERTIPAPSLKGNLLGDPTQQKVYIYLPPGYDTTPTKRFPTLYLLHGFLSSSTVWVTGSYQGLNLQTLMDELIKSGKVREMIVVAANGNNSYGGSFYTNSTVTGNWDDFITHDLVGNIDANYRTIPRPESRGIAAIHGRLRRSHAGHETPGRVQRALRIEPLLPRNGGRHERSESSVDESSEFIVERPIDSTT